MNILALIIFLAIVAIALFFGFRLLKAFRKIRRLERDRDEFKSKCEKLTRLNDNLTSGASVQLTSYERQLILMAMEYPPHRDMIQSPQTKKFIRDVWRGLREKIKASIKEDG